MNMREVTAAFRMRHWAGIVEERKVSGLSVRAYCENAGIHENSYYYWQKKLREAAYEEMADIGGNAIDLEPLRFMEVRLPAQQVQATSGSDSQGQVCIESAGVRITASGEYPADRLAVLLREVARPC